MHDPGFDRLECNSMLHDELFGFAWMTFTGTVWTFKSVVALSKSAQ